MLQFGSARFPVELDVQLKRRLSEFGLMQSEPSEAPAPEEEDEARSSEPCTVGLCGFFPFFFSVFFLGGGGGTFVGLEVRATAGKPAVSRFLSL